MTKQDNVLELIKSKIEEKHGLEYYESIENLLPLLIEIGLTIPKDKSIRRFFKCLCIHRYGRNNQSEKTGSRKNTETHQAEKNGP